MFYMELIKFFWLYVDMFDLSFFVYYEICSNLRLSFLFCVLCDVNETCFFCKIG